MAKVEVPETRYARNGPVSIAYQVVSDGPIDVVYAPAEPSHLDYSWQYPPLANLCILAGRGRMESRGPFPSAPSCQDRGNGYAAPSARVQVCTGSP